MNIKWLSAAVVAAFVAAGAAFLYPASVGLAQDRQGDTMALATAASAPSCGMMCDKKACQENMARLDQALKALEEARKAATGGDAKAAAAGIEKAQALLKDSQACMKKMAASAPAAGKIVNTKCPIMGAKVDPDKTPASLTRQYKGRTIGFCCPMCPPQWDKLSDAEKDKKLADALKP